MTFLEETDNNLISEFSDYNEVKAKWQNVIPCDGNGLFHYIRDQCIGDGGNTGVNDNLELYCCNGVTRACLSGESCIWRRGCVSTDKTCDRSGLANDVMAWMVPGPNCSKWRGISNYYCDKYGNLAASS